MRSHVHECRPADLLRVLTWPLLPVAVFAGAMHLGTWAKLWPAPRPALDVDRTVLIHQAEAARSVQNAEIVLLGDSSCLMDVSARQLAKELGRPVLNLGTLSYVDLEAQARLLRLYHAANPDRLRTVVLLMHPETLRLAPTGSWQTQALHSFLDGMDHSRTDRFGDRVARWLGLEVFRGRILARTLPRPLPGAFGRRYGFSSDLERFLTANLGSALDPESRPPSGRPDYRLAPAFKAASARFRQSVPPSVRLIVGITPVPESFVDAGHAARLRPMLAEWGAWLKADGVLTHLPATLAEEVFAQKTHLNDAGQRIYTTKLAEALRQ